MKITITQEVNAGIAIVAIFIKMFTTLIMMGIEKGKGLCLFIILVCLIIAAYNTYRAFLKKNRNYQYLKEYKNYYKEPESGSSKLVKIWLYFCCITMILILVISLFN